MARNKYPEETVERILDAAQRLFLEKGYEATTIQDIVSALGGLTKGAVYHHFKSKEEIMDAVEDRMFAENNPFEAVRGRVGLSGLEKLREVVRLNQADAARAQMNLQAIPITRNPRVLAGLIESNRRTLTPYFAELLEEGNRDGSLHTAYVRELSELIPLLTSLWLLPSVFPANREELKHKFRFLGEMLQRMGVPLVDDAILRMADDFLDRLEDG